MNKTKVQNSQLTDYGLVVKSWTSNPRVGGSSPREDKQLDNKKMLINFEE